MVCNNNQWINIINENMQCVIVLYDYHYFILYLAPIVSFNLPPVDLPN